MFSKKILNNFSEQVELVKVEKNFDFLYEALEYIIESNVYDFLTYSNCQQFINKTLKEKLLLEYSQKNMIRKEFEKNESQVLF